MKLLLVIIEGHLYLADILAILVAELAFLFWGLWSRRPIIGLVAVFVTVPLLRSTVSAIRTANAVVYWTFWPLRRRRTLVLGLPALTTLSTGAPRRDCTRTGAFLQRARSLRGVESMRMPPPTVRSAGEELLGTELERLADWLDRRWVERNGDTWLAIAPST